MKGCRYVVETEWGPNVIINALCNLLSLSMIFTAKNYRVILVKVVFQEEVSTSRFRNRVAGIKNKSLN